MNEAEQAVLQNIGNAANILLGVANVRPELAQPIEDFCRLFSEKALAGEPFLDCVAKAAELAGAEALLRSRL